MRFAWPVRPRKVAAAADHPVLLSIPATDEGTPHHLSNRWWMKAQAGARVDPASMKPAGALSPTHSTASFRSSASSVPSSASRIVGGPKPLRAPPKWAKDDGAPSLYIGPWQVRVASSILFYFIPPIRLFVAVLLTRSLSSLYRRNSHSAAL